MRLFPVPKEAKLFLIETLQKLEHRLILRSYNLFSALKRKNEVCSCLSKCSFVKSPVQ